ncbi:MAG: transposase [Thermomicrobiales bacterium]
MEDVLNVYQWPREPTHPVVCLDETNRQLLDKTRPQPVAPGQPARQDPEDVRGGIANLLRRDPAAAGWWSLMVSTQRTRLDFAACIKALVDDHSPDAERIILIKDQLNIPHPGRVLCSLSARGSQTPQEQAGVLSHPET